MHLRLRPSSCLPVLLGLIAALGCAKHKPKAEAPAPQKTPEKSDSWANWEVPRLCNYVEKEAESRLRRVHPEWTRERLGAAQGDVSALPELSGEGVEALIDLAVCSIARGELERAQREIDAVYRKARHRNAAFAGHLLLVEIARRRATSGKESVKAMSEVLAALPPSRFEQFVLILNSLGQPRQLRAVVAQLHQQPLSPQAAARALLFGTIFPELAKQNAFVLRASEDARAKIAAAPRKEIEFALPKLSAQASKGKSLNIALIDTGASLKAIAATAFEKGAEKIDGKDNDGNGIVDDRHGFADDEQGVRGEALFFQPSPETLQSYRGYLQGLMDLRSGLPSTPASRNLFEALQKNRNEEEVRRFESALNDVGDWAHGTFSASIVLEGNPATRAAVFRIAWLSESRTYPRRTPSDEELAKEEKSLQLLQKFIVSQRIRLIYTPAFFSEAYLLDQLVQSATPSSSWIALQRRAAEIHGRRREMWQRFVVGCPDTLFIVPAGNGNRDVVESGDLPASLDAPNLLAVGAVNSGGEWAVFTNSHPERVPLFALGLDVEGTLPDGERAKFSGTSFAAARVANVAAKALVLSPSLTPTHLRTLLIEQGEAIPSPFAARRLRARETLSTLGYRP